MTKRALMPEALKQAATRAHMSPGLIAGQLVFLTGATGGEPDGRMPDDPERQFVNAFEKIRATLDDADLTFDALVEMTSYHVGLRAHFELFDRVRLDYVTAPYPAWTAVEVAGLRRPGAIVEIRAVAMLPD